MRWFSGGRCRRFAVRATHSAFEYRNRPASPLLRPRRAAAHEMPGHQTEEVMDKVSVILPAATTVLLIAMSGCATRGDVEALRSDIAALRASTESAGAAHTATTTPAEYQKLRSDIAALQASIESAGATRSTSTTPPAAYERLRSDIAALRAS